MIIRWQSKSRLIGSFQQINAVVTMTKKVIAVINHDVTGLEYSMPDNKIQYVMSKR